MSWYREAKAGLGVILMLATLVAVGVQSCRSTRRFRQANLEVDRARQEQRQLIALRLGVEQAAASERGYLISGEESALDPYHVAISEIAEDLKNLKAAVSAEPGRARSVSEIELLAGSVEGGFEAAIEARKNVIASGRIHPVTPATQATLDELRQRIDSMATYAARRRDRELIGAQTGFRDVVWSLVSLTGLASLLVILAYLVARRDVAKRSRAEQALIESEERFRQISNSLQDILWVASPQDPHGCYVSAAYEPITGRSIKSFYENPRSFLDLIHPLDRDRTERVLAAQMRGEVESTNEYRIIRADGATRWLRSHCFPIRARSGGLQTLVGVTQDVTDHRRAEEDLRHSEDQLRLVIEGVEDLKVVMLDPEGRVVTWNAGAERINGYRKDEILGKHFSLLYPEEGVREGTPEQELKTALADGRCEREGWHVRKDGSRLWAETTTTALRDANGRLRGFGRVTRDITERKLVEEALRESERRYRLLFERNLAGVCLTAPDGRIVNCNEAFARTFGYESRADLLTHTFWDLYDDPAECAAVQAKLREGGFSGLEFRGRRKDGSPVALLSSMALIVTENAKQSVIQATIIDITRRKEAESISQSLLRISAKLNSTLDVDSLLDALVVETIGLMAAEGGCSGLRAGNTLVCHNVMHNSARVPVKHAWLPKEGTPGWVLETKTPYLSNDARSDQRVARNLTTRFGVRSLVTMPLLDSHGEVLGFFEIHNKPDSQGFTPADQKLLLGVSQVASIAIQNALAYRKVGRAEKTLRQLSGRLLKSQDEERRRIARNLHDSTAQNMAALVMNLTQLEGCVAGSEPRARGVLSDSLALAEQSARELRTLSYLLHPPLLDEIGLGAALRQYVDGFIRRSGIRVYLDVPDAAGQLPLEISTTLFRIVQESLTNIHKHSGSLTAHIRLSRLNGDLILEVADRGGGLSPAVMDSLDGGLTGLGVGITGMQERISQLGGRLEIRSGTGGTIVHAKLHYKDEGA